MELMLPFLVFAFLFIIKDVHILPLLLLLTASYLTDKRWPYKWTLILFGLLAALYFDVLEYSFILLPFALPSKYLISMAVPGFYLIFMNNFEASFLLTITSLSAYLKNLLDSYDDKYGRLSLNFHIIKEREANYRKEEAQRINRENELSRLDERSRISSELHHIIGHAVTTSLMRLEVMKIKSKDEEVKGDIEALKNDLKKSMEEIRATIHKMKDDSIDLKRELELLKVEGGLNINLEMNFENIDKDLKTEVLNLVKEAITNTRKHSDAKNIYISIKEERMFYKIQISDDGRSEGEFKKGLGLKSMEDLARRHGGYFNAENNEGFMIFLTIMKEAQE